MIEVINNPSDKCDTKANADTGVSKEDEERYQKLLHENDELQRLIAQVCLTFISPYLISNCYLITFNLSQKEDKIRILRQRLQDTDGNKKIDK